MPAGRRGRVEAAVPVVAVLTAAVVVLLGTAWVCDDALITLRTVDNFVHGYGLRWNIGERVQTYTHPLWLAVLVPIHALTNNGYWTALAAGAAVSAAFLAWLATRPAAGTRDGRWTMAVPGWIAALALLQSRAFVDFSTSGLENPLTHALLGVGLLYALCQELPTARRLACVAAWAAALGLCRLDLLASAGPLLAVAAWRAQRAVGTWRAVAAVGVGFGPLVAWLGFATWYYGAPLPNTAYAKLGAGIPQQDLIVQGLRYYANVWRWDPITPALTLAGVAVGLHAAVRQRSAARGAAAVGIVLQLLWVVWVGGDFMAGRFWTPPLVAAVVLAAASLPAWPRRRGAQVGAIAALCVLALPGRSPAWWIEADHGKRAAIDWHGIGDERAWYWDATGLYNGAPLATPRPIHPLWQRGQALRGSQRVVASLEAGMLGLAAGPLVHIIDRYALCDAFLARLPMTPRDPVSMAALARYGANPAAPWRVGHYLRDVPPGYVRSLREGGNHLPTPALRALYDDVVQRTRP